MPGGCSTFSIHLLYTSLPDLPLWKATVELRHQSFSNPRDKGYYTALTFWDLHKPFWTPSREPLDFFSLGTSKNLEFAPPVRLIRSKCCAETASNAPGVLHLKSYYVLLVRKDQKGIFFRLSQHRKLRRDFQQLICSGSSQRSFAFRHVPRTFGRAHG